ncbi:MAG TPA: OsmC family protein [Gemmatimonadaceae bacterium]|nr:OsmC family protein [Gemmatimonadaceae bacterium]
MKPPSRTEVRWVGGNRFDAGRPDRPKIRIDGSAETGPGPVDTLMCALAACTSEDVLSILEKRRTPAKALRVEAEGIRADAVPARVISASLTYHVDGDGIEPEQVVRAATLAVEKYCSVRDTLDKAMPIAVNVYVNGVKA